MDLVDGRMRLVNESRCGAHGSLVELVYEDPVVYTQMRLGSSSVMRDNSIFTLSGVRLTRA